MAFKHPRSAKGLQEASKRHAAGKPESRSFATDFVQVSKVTCDSSIKLDQA
jgi:hypothetical protein